MLFTAVKFLRFFSFPTFFPFRCCAYLPAFFFNLGEREREKKLRVGRSRVYRGGKKEHIDTFYPGGVSCGIHDIVRRNENGHVAWNILHIPNIVWLCVLLGTNKFGLPKCGGVTKSPVTL